MFSFVADVQTKSQAVRRRTSGGEIDLRVNLLECGSECPLSRPGRAFYVCIVLVVEGTDLAPLVLNVHFLSEISVFHF